MKKFIKTIWKIFKWTVIVILCISALGVAFRSCNEEEMNKGTIISVVNDSTIEIENDGETIVAYLGVKVPVETLQQYIGQSVEFCENGQTANDVKGYNVALNDGRLLQVQLVAEGAEILEEFPDIISREMKDAALLGKYPA